MSNPKLVLRYPRPIGAAFVIGGLGLGYLSILLPVKAAQQHAPDVSISMGGVFMTVFSLLLGLVFLISGTQFARFFVVEKEQSKTPVYLTAAVISLVGLATYMLLQKYLEGYGYVF